MNEKIERQSDLLKDIKLMIPEDEKEAFLQLESILQANIKEHGLLHESTWKISSEICSILNKVALQLLKENNFILSEQYFLKAKQLTEPNTNKNGWINDFSWHKKRILIGVNLSVLYKKQQLYKPALQLLSSIEQDLKVSTDIIKQSYSDPDSNIELVFFSIAELLYEIQKYDRMIYYLMKAQRTIEDYIPEIGFLLEVKNAKIPEQWKQKKLLLLSQINYLKGKYTSKVKRDLNKSLEYFQKSHQISLKVLGPNSPFTEMYKQKEIRI